MTGSHGDTGKGDEELLAWSVASIIERIASCMNENEVACTLRLLNKLTAAVLCGRTRVRMSRRCPRHAFARRWGARGAMRPLTYRQRQALLTLAAASGCVANLQLALSVVGCTPTAEVFAAAAAAGHLPACEVLLAAGCPWGPEVLDAAARAGRRDAVAWLLRAGCAAGPQLLAAAAGAGHDELCEWLVSDAGQPWDAEAARAAARGGFTALFEHAAAQLAGGGGAVKTAALRMLLEGAAEGCSLITLVWLHRTFVDEPDQDQNGPRGTAEAPAPGNEQLQPGNQPQQLQQQPGGGGGGGLSAEARGAIVDAAAASPTSDWRAKVEWLRAHGYPLSRTACGRAAAAAAGGGGGGGENAPAARLAWLRQQGFPVNWHIIAAAAAAGQREDLVEAVAAEAPGCLDFLAGKAADSAGLAFLRGLHARGVCLRGGLCLVAAARRGDVEAAEWLLQTFGAGAEGGAGGGGRGAWAAVLTRAVFAAGAESGSGEMLEWLHARGCEWGDGGTFTAAAGAGSEEQVEWLAAQGCPMGDDGEAFVLAARNGDLSTLALLRRLGCPWGPRDGAVFTAAVAWASELRVLGWLLAAGCPVDWGSALDAASLRQRPPGVVAWLQEQQRQRQQRGRRCVVQ